MAGLGQCARLTISFWYFDADDLDQREKGDRYDPPEPVPDPNVVTIRRRSGELAHVSDAEMLVWMFDTHYEVQVETDVFTPAVNCQELLAIARSVDVIA